MSEVHVVASLSPKNDKVDRVKDLMKEMIENVHSKEDYTLRYLMTEKLDGGDSPEIVMFETYKDKASADKHMTEPHFQAMFAKVSEEELLTKAPWIVQTKSVQGFDLGRELV